MMKDVLIFTAAISVAIVIAAYPWGYLSSMGNMRALDMIIAGEAHEAAPACGTEM